MSLKRKKERRKGRRRRGRSQVVVVLFYWLKLGCVVRTVFHGLYDDGRHGKCTIANTGVGQNLNRVLSKLSKLRQRGRKSCIARHLFVAERHVKCSVIHFIAFDDAVAMQEFHFVPSYHDRRRRCRIGRYSIRPRTWSYKSQRKK